MVFWDGYCILQELLRYNKYDSYTESEKFMNRIIAKLNSSGDELLIKTADSFEKWKVGIINGLAKIKPAEGLVTLLQKTTIPTSKE